ncbi:PDZ domain-containing protein [Nonomuraea sp. NPDC003201]
MLTVLDRKRAGEEVGVPEWIDLVVAELGERARRDFAALEAGEWMVPASDALGPRFRREDLRDRVAEVGFDLAGMETGVVAGLVAGSAAVRAGMREGDRILAGPSGSDLAKGSPAEVTFTLARGGWRCRTSRAAPRSPPTAGCRRSRRGGTGHGALRSAPRPRRAGR